MKKNKLIFFLSFIILSFLIIPNISYAQILPACTATGNCGFCDIIDTIVKIFRWLLGILGGTALFLLVWHGFGWLTSAGNAEKIESTKKALIHTIVGLLIILASWMIVNIVLVILLTPVQQQADPGQGVVQSIFSPSGPKWYQYCTGGIKTYCVGKGEGTPCSGDKKAGTFCLTRCVKWDTNNNTCINGKEDFVCSRWNYKRDGTYDDACEYWSKNSKQYKGYKCEPSYNCTAGKVLGSQYCKTDNTTCCLPK